MSNWRRITVKTLALGAALAGVAGCGRQRAEPTPNPSVSARTGWATKEIVGKRAPETLVANDGTICRVSPDRFANSRVGTSLRCNWQ